MGDRFRWVPAVCSIAALASGCGDRASDDTCGISASDGAAAPLSLELATGTPVELSSGWELRTSDEVGATGDEVSSACYDASGWARVRVPTTVLAALVANGVYADPYYGMNLRDVPGTDYPIGFDFANFDMSEDSPFAVPWWYRFPFTLANDIAGRRVWLTLHGINYRANVWLNGNLVAGSDELVGTFRQFRLDLTDALNPSGVNTLAVEVFAPNVASLAHTFIDWMPFPPDKNMGLWREVELSVTGSVAVQRPQVVTDLPLPSTDTAAITVRADVTNYSDASVDVDVTADLAGSEFTRTVTLPAGETHAVEFTPEDYADLNIESPALWWPAGLGDQPLQALAVRATIDGILSDETTLRFGIREVTSELTAEGHRLYSVNGQRILVRGAGWAPDMMLRADRAREDDEVALVRDMNLNTVRLEGYLGTEHLLDRFDEEGVLVIAGWPCCNHWMRWPEWTDEDYQVAEASERDQVLRLRNRPSILSWWNGSDAAPPPDVEQMFVDLLEENHWPTPYLSSADSDFTPVTGATGVRMTGPYNYVPPSYWLEDTTNGGAFGFNTETSPGPAPLGLESLAKTLPAEHLWPADEYWTFHAGGHPFAALDVFDDAMTARLGGPSDAEDYVRKADVLTYDGERAMFEGFRKNAYRATGVIQWMLNTGWPGMIWHLYDWYLAAGGGYYGAKRANVPTHILYGYNDRTVVVSNLTPARLEGLRARVELYDTSSALLLEEELPLDVAADSVTPVTTVHLAEPISTTYFLRLVLSDSEGSVVDRNFYWLSTQPDVIDWNASTWEYAPVARHADLTGMNDLPDAALDVRATEEPVDDDAVFSVTVSNPNGGIVPMVWLRVAQGSSHAEVLPTFWEDNYFALVPGETRTIRARIAAQDRIGDATTIQVAGWNVLEQAVAPTQGGAP